VTGPIRTFRAAYSAHLRSITRFLTVPGYIGYSVAGPLFALLTSWVIGSRVLSNVSYFQSLTGSSSYLTWVVIGFAFQSFIFSAAFGGAQAIRGEQEHGTAELVFITPANKVAWLIGKMAADQTFSLIGFSILLALGGLFFGLTLGPTPNIPLAALGILLTMLSLSAFGMVFAGITFLAKRANHGVLLRTSLPRGSAPKDCPAYQLGLPVNLWTLHHKNRVAHTSRPHGSGHPINHVANLDVTA